MFAQSSVHGVEIWSIAGWTMLHFLWLGALVGVLAMVGRLVVWRASAQLRYALAFTNLAVLAALPIAIAAWVTATSKPAVLPLVTFVDDEIVELNQPAPTPITPTALGSAGGGETVDVAQAVDSPAVFAPTNPRQSRGLLTVEALEACVPYLPWVWLVGTPLTFALLATGIVGAERFRRSSRIIDDGPIADACTRLKQSLGVTRRVAVAVCERIAAPVLVGILRPVILLPPAALTGWSPDEIEMVLLHELAHVRRWDNLVNLMQRLIESLLFFHPAVWLVSNWVRREREACCDTIVVQRTNRAHAYAEMLVALAAQMPRSVLFHPAASSAMAAGPLRGRIRRILQLDDDPMLVSGKSFAIVLAGLLLAATLSVLYLPTIGQAEESNATAIDSTEKHERKSESDDGAVELTTDERRIDVQGGESINAADEGELRRNVTPDQNASEIGRVIASFHVDQDPGVWNALFKAVDEARAKEFHVDLVSRGNQLDLVVARPPREADWPMSLGEPPRKERVVAERAWQLLGLKLVPASLLEIYERDIRGMRAGGVKIVGGNVPNGLPLPAFLQKIDTKRLDNFDDLNTWLSNINSTGPFKVSAAASGDDYLFDTQPLQKNVLVESTSPATQSTRSARFPSLEDQKLRDLVYKAMDIEVEPISEDELQRVKTLGYDGGVRITEVVAEARGRFFPNDILVGLHVWPTTSLEKIAEVLRRDDVVELNPLKFYVVRQASKENGEGFKDVVVSGRFAVRAAPQTTPSSPAAKPGASQFLKQQDESSTNSQWHPTTRPANVDRSPGGAPELSADVPRGAAQHTPTSSDLILEPAGEGPRNNAAEKSLLIEPVLTPDAALQRPPAVSADDGQRLSVKSINKANLRYDGKSFVQWLSAWKDELSTERRCEAVQALAAFGAHGYGHEAAEAILDVVKQYDWSVIGQSPVSKLKNEAILALTGNGEGAASIPMDDWLPVLVEGVRSGDKRTVTFAQYVFQNLSLDNDAARKLVELSRDESLKSIKLAIIQRLMTKYDAFSTENDPEIEKRLVEALKEGPVEASIAMRALYASNARDMGMGGGGYGRGTGGGMMSRGGGMEVVQPVIEYRPELIDLLKTSEPQLSLVVIDVLEQMGAKARPAVPQLLPLIFTLERGTAARLALAIRSITGSDDEVNAFLRKTIDENKLPENVKRAEQFLRGIKKIRAVSESGAARDEDPFGPAE